MTPLRPGTRFLHARLLDTSWKPSPGERYADAPPATCEITAVRQGWIYYKLLGAKRSVRYFPADRASQYVREFLPRADA